MTYGVDQCRICGKTISVLRPTAMEEWERAQRKPIIPEKQWRALGMLAAPTARQWHTSQADGCCSACGMMMLNRRWKYTRRGIWLIAIFVAITTLVSFIILYLPH